MSLSLNHDNHQLINIARAPSLLDRTVLKFSLLLKSFKAINKQRDGCNQLTSFLKDFHRSLTEVMLQGRLHNFISILTRLVNI